ncbi:hypothetical protein Tco_1106409 [Tanacetum coccineum]
MTQIWANGESFKDDQYILATQVKQVFYLKDTAKRPPNLKVIKDVNHKKFLNGGVIVVEDDHDVIYFDNSSDLTHFTSLNDLDFATLHIDDSDDEDLINVDDDDVVMSVDVARGHDGDGGGDDRSPPHQIGGDCRGKGTRKPNLGGRKAGRLNTCKETRNLGLRKIMDEFGPRRSEERKAGVIGKIWGTEQHLAKIYTDNKSSLKAEHWAANPDDGTYDVEGTRSRYPANISVADWDAQIAFWSNLKNVARHGRSCPYLEVKFPPVYRRGISQPISMESSATQEYPSLIQTYFDTNTVDGVFLQDEERLLYEEMLRLHGLGTYTNDHIMAIVRRGKQQGHILSVSRVLAGKGRDILVSPKPRCMHTANVDELKRTNKQLNKQMDMIMKVVRSNDKMSQLLTQLQSQHEVDSDSGSAEAGMMSWAMMRTPTRRRMRMRMRIVRTWNESPLIFPRHVFPGDMSLGKRIPMDMSPGIGYPLSGLQLCSLVLRLKTTPSWLFRP